MKADRAYLPRCSSCANTNLGEPCRSCSSHLGKDGRWVIRCSWVPKGVFPVREERRHEDVRELRESVSPAEVERVGE